MIDGRNWKWRNSASTRAYLLRNKISLCFSFTTPPLGCSDNILITMYTSLVTNLTAGPAIAGTLKSRKSTTSEPKRSPLLRLHFPPLN